jgi:hypothetical protein
MIITEHKLRRIIRKVLLEKDLKIYGTMKLRDPSKPHSYVSNPRDVAPKKYEINPSGKKFHELPGYAKNRQVNIYDDLMDDENDVLRNDIFDLIDKSYAYIGGNADIRAAWDLSNPKQNDYVDFLAWDIDDDPEADVLRGMKPKAGYTKLSLSATDMSKAAGEYSANDTALRLRDGKHYAEMSGKAATVQMRVGTPAVTNQATAQSLLPGKSFTWFGEHPALYTGDDEDKAAIAASFKDDRGSQIEAKKSKQYGENGQYDGWYVRMLGGSPHAKMIFGAIG